MIDFVKKKINRRILRKKNNINISKTAQVDNNSKIGEYTYIGDYAIITKSTIGRYCSIAPMVTIGLGEHDINDISTSARFYGENSYEKLTKNTVIIGNDVWIGSKAMILRGVKIGDGAVVGAGAVVTKDVPDFAVVVGVPAKIIKYRFTPQKAKEIKNSLWWNYSIEEARKVQKNLNIEDEQA